MEEEEIHLCGHEILALDLHPQGYHGNLNTETPDTEQHKSWQESSKFNYLLW